MKMSVVDLLCSNTTHDPAL